MEYSLTNLKDQIYFSKTKEYFDEIEKSYYNENYRSAVVMLYSVVISDLLYKLEELRDYYSDKVAEKILTEINTIRESNPKSSEWENKLIEKIEKETNIIESYTITNLEYLKNIRNFSAHPALNQNNELIKPSREKTLGLIKDMLTGILIRPPLFIKKITENILEDIAEKKEDFIDDDVKFKKYISKKYFERMPKNMIIGIFKDFWKLVFKTENEDCNNNRRINLKFLILTMKEYKIIILEDFRKDKDKYNQISENPNLVIFLAEFMHYFPEVYSYLNEQNKIIVDVSTNTKKEYRLLVFYMYNNFEEHLKSLNRMNFNNDYTKKIFEERAQEEGVENLLIDKYIKFFASSTSYNMADEQFERFIRPYIRKMHSKQIIELISEINKNNQIYGRGRSLHDNNEIINNANVDWKKIDLDSFENFKYDERLLIEDDLPF